MKNKIKKHLQTLELEQVVTRKNDYQDMINMIAQVNIVNDYLHVKHDSPGNY